MRQPQTTSKDGCFPKDRMESENMKETCSMLQGELGRRDRRMTELVWEAINRDNQNRAYKKVKKNKGKPGFNGTIFKW